jgi:NADH-quinone oxidoreductase subunit M
LGNYITFPDLLIWLPLLAAIFSFISKDEKGAKNSAIVFSLLILGVSVATLFFTNDTQYLSYNYVNYIWLKYMGANYYVGLDGTGRLLTLLTAIGFPLILVSTSNSKFENPSRFYGLMMLTQAGLMGVFMAMDALTFYFFWELALIPVYFLCSIWGGEKRIQATFKFFVYTFAGSLLMLIGIIYVYLHTQGRVFADGTTSLHSFALSAFYTVQLSASEQNWLFILFFIAFAIKMPIFPFHTWQPEAYNQSPTSVTMVLSGIMVKMGLFGAMRWLIPVFPEASAHFKQLIVILSVIGIVYASCIAMMQDNIKKLVAYSSIAHIGLMSAAIFSMNQISVQGAMMQMFNHGINIIGMWVVIDIIERRTGAKKISELSGLAHSAPVLTILFIVIALANIALPLTNAFTGEFLMFSGLYNFSHWMAAVAGIGIILSAVYTLNMIQKVFYGSVNSLTTDVKDVSWNEKLVLIIIVGIIFFVGIYPQPLIELTKEAVNNLVVRVQ